MCPLVDGKPNPETSLSDQQELSKVMTKHATSLDSVVQQASIAKQRLHDCRDKVQSMHNLVKNAQKNYSLAATLLQKKQALYHGLSMSKSGRSRSATAVDDDDRAAFRVTDIIGALRVTADRRREQSDQKKNTGFSSAWVQSFPGLPSSLKKSLWHKMHRRKQQVILRPSPESMVSDLRSNIAMVAASKYNDRDKIEKIESEMMKAEQLYLLATHPFSEDSLPCVPPIKSSENWSEPGWKLNLSVPTDNRNDMILPCSPSFPVMECNLAEIASTPGRQAASMLRTSHFRCLASPLSAFAVASSAAESNTALPLNRTHADGDPLHTIDEEILIGYKFCVKPIPPPAKVSQPRRRASTPKSQLETESNLLDSSSKRSSASASSNAKTTESVPSQGVSDRKKTESKRQRASSKAPEQTSKKVKADVAAAPSPQIPSQPYSPIVQKQHLQQHQSQASPPALQRQTTQIHHQPRQHGQQHQRQQLSAQQQRQMHHQVSRHPQSQHHPQMSTPQHHQQMSSSQHHQQHITQQPYSPQMNQMRMMQQQSQQMQNMSPRHQQVAASYPPQAIQQMQQFYAPLNHPQAPMHMQGRAVPPPPPHPPTPHLQQPQPQQAPQQGVNGAGQVRKSDDPNDANDPLFMLK